MRIAGGWARAIVPAAIATAGVQYGSFIHENKDIDHPLKVNGVVKIERCNVTSPVTVWGWLSSSNSIFSGKIVAFAHEISFDDTTITRPGEVAIEMYIQKGYVGKVILRGKSHVQGDIIFHGAPGHVVHGSEVSIDGEIKQPQEADDAE